MNDDREYIALPDNPEKRVGVLIDNVFHRVVYGSKHLYRTRPGPGWAMDYALAEELEARGVEAICAVDMETNTQYRVSMEKFMSFARPIVNHGDGEQICLHIRFWKDSPYTEKNQVLEELM